MSEICKNDPSRRGLLRAGLMIIAGGAAVAATAARADDSDSKVDQSVVQYQTSPKDGAQCSGCVNFVAPNALQGGEGRDQPERLVRRLRAQGELRLAHPGNWVKKGSSSFLRKRTKKLL